MNIDYKDLFRNTPTPFLLIRPDAPLFTILDANDAYLAATFTSHGEIVGKGLFESFPDNPKDPSPTGERNLRASLEKVIEEKRTHIMGEQKYDVPLPAGQGFRKKYWKPSNTPVLNDRGEILYIIHQAEDVTHTVELKLQMSENAQKAAAEIHSKSMIIRENENRIRELLSAMLRYTTMDFSQKLEISEKGDELDAIAEGLNSLIRELEHQTGLLKQANTDLELANSELDSFSYSVSHDLRAPLRAINGYSQVLMEDYGTGLDGDARKVIETIMRNATRMATLIEDLLTFSRLGKQSLAKTQLDMQEIVVRALSDFKGQAEFTVNPLADSLGDSSMLTQVWSNLISNAVKYSREKEQPLIEIGSYNEKERTVYYIKDNGAGFDMKYYDKLFGVFQRLHHASQYEGTGVGLALVQRIIRKHQGEIWAESVEGKGATFYFSLPAG